MKFEYNFLESLTKMNIMGVPNPNIEELNESFESVLVDSDVEVGDGVDDDNMASAVVPDRYELDSDISDDSDEEAANTWKDHVREYDRWTFNDPVGAALEEGEYETPLQFYKLFFSEELLETVAEQSNICGQEKRQHWTYVNTAELRTFFGFCLQISRCPFDSLRNYWSL